MKTSWEAAVRTFRRASSVKDVEDNYFDLPAIEAARRFAASPEFVHVLDLLGRGNGRTVLDVGAGVGIASFAFAQAGWRVIAIEPDPSAEVGSASVAELARQCSGQIVTLRAIGEALPIRASSVDAVYARQALHHSRDLEKVVAEASRVLKPGGLLLACREHVVDNDEQLSHFLATHPLHACYGGENAYSQARYLAAARSAGLELLKCLGPEESIINFYPGTFEALSARWRDVACRTWRPLGTCLAWSATFQLYAIRRAERLHPVAGRLYSFLWERQA